MWKIFEFLSFKKSDFESAKKLFQDNGLTFPMIPEKLAEDLKEQEKWLFSTRKIQVSPYFLQQYVNELDKNDVKDYVVLSHAGRGINSYAIQYYLVHNNLKMFLHLRWGGVYINTQNAAADIQTCFSLADKIVLTVESSEKLQTGSDLKIVCSDSYGSYWSAPGKEEEKEDPSFKNPVEVLTEVLHWLQK